MPHVLFEVSWEVANKVGGIHTVVTSKAPTLVDRLGDDYITIGPWLGGEHAEHAPFDEDPGFEDFRRTLQEEEGIHVRVGRWRTPGRPRTILVGFSGLFEKRDGILAGLWERYGVDSLHGSWDYIEPVLFAHATGIVIDRWWHEFVAHRRVEAVAQFHEWLTAAGLLYLKERLPSVGTVFTTHATMLGRALAGTGRQPLDGLDGRSPREVSIDAGVRSKHSLEGVAAREADVFTTVSRITAEEATLFHDRAPDPLLPNGLDLDLLDEISGSAPTADVRARLARLALAVTGENADDAFFVSTSGRYEVHNKGYDVLLRALARLEGHPGQSVVAFFLVPAGISGVNREVRARYRDADFEGGRALGLTTHDLLDPEGDPIRFLAQELGLENAPGSRVKIVHVPVYLHGDDGLLDLPYEALVRATDLSSYPSFYEPWGYTPAESVALGVPTITTDCAGFGRWARENDLGADDGVLVLPRIATPDEEAVEELALTLARALETLPSAERVAERCRATASNLAWADLIRHYDEAFAKALADAAERAPRTPLSPQRRRVPLTPQPHEDAARPHLLPLNVKTVLPETLHGLKRLATNLWWCWDPEAPTLFRDVDPRLWEASGHNPYVLLRSASSDHLDAVAADPAYRERLQRVVARFEAYLDGTQDEMDLGDGGIVDRHHPIAYFCFEFALQESLRLYSGGLGALAGDHLKAASDLALPFVALGLFYRGGYVEQQLDADGTPVLRPAPNDPANLPMERVLCANGEPALVTVDLPDRKVHLGAWRVDVGRVPLYLLDADLDLNSPEDRKLTYRLYAGPNEHRLQQEMLLGLGGVRLLTLLGLEPAAVHLNEGHAAFAALERTAHLVREHGLSPEEARTVVRATTAFTTHTPVPAGHDVFDEDRMRRYFAPLIASAGFSWERFLEFGRAPGGNGPFNMTYLAAHLASWVGGVSEKHGEVSRTLLHPLWPGLLTHEVPVGHVTNGVHLATWTHPGISALLGAGERRVTGDDFRDRAASVDASALWSVRRTAKEDLLGAIRTQVDRLGTHHHTPASVVARMREGLDPDALWIGFARRLAPYKRADLLLRYRDRLRQLLGDDDRPVRIVFAGKAHPDDGRGAEILDQLLSTSRSSDLAGRVYFLEDYDLRLARLLVQGVDVWLNNPVPPLEASGTSGMKAAANGGLNLSVLDGWWIEGCDGRNGWGVGADRPTHETAPASQDARDASEIFALLEDEVVPLFYDRDAAGVPHAWLDRARHAMLSLAPVFDTGRMVSDYARLAYGPLAARWRTLSADDFAEARRLSDRRREVMRGMEQVRILATRIGPDHELAVGDRLEAEMDVDLGPLAAGDVVAELLVGRSAGTEELQDTQVVALADRGGTNDNGVRRFEGSVVIRASGPHAYGLRVRPRELSEGDLTLRRLLRWA